MKKSINDLVKDNAIILLGIIILIAIHVLVMLINGYAPFGDGVYVKGDNISQLPGYISELKNKLSNNESLYYTWGVTGGGSFWYIMAYSLINITMIPLALVPLKLFNGALSLCYIILSVAMYLTVTYYLTHRYSKYVLSKNSPELLVFSLPYALSPAFVDISAYYPYAAVFFVVPLLVLGLERFFHNEGFRLYFISLSVIFIMNFYVAFICSIFVILYYLTFEFDNIKHFVKKSISVLLLSICAVGVSSVVVIPVFLNVSGGGYGLSKGVELGFMSSLMYMFKQFLWGRPAVLTGSSDSTRYECNLYTGLFVGIMLILYFVNKKFDIKTRIKRGAVLLIMLLSFSESFTNYLFHLFHYTSGMPNRQTLLFVFYCIIIACDNYISIKNKKKKSVTISIAVVCGLVLILMLFSKTSLLMMCVNAFLVLCYCSLSIFKIKKKAVVLTFVACVEVATGYMVLFNNSSSGRDYFEEANEVKSIMASIDDTSFYNTTYNDIDVNTNMGLLCGYNCISGYSNIAREGYINALSKLGINSYRNNIRDRGYNSLLNSLFSRKYLIENKDIDHAYDLADRNYYSFKKYKENDELELYMNDNMLSPVIVSDNSLDDFDRVLMKLDKDSSVSKTMNSLAYDLTGVKDAVCEIRVSPKITNCDNCQGEFYEDYLVFIPDTDSDGDGYNPSKSSTVQVAFEAPVSGEYIVDITNNYCVGYYSKGEIVTANASIAGSDYNRETGVYATDISVNVLDIDKYKEAYNFLKDKQMTIIECKSDKLVGILKCDKKSTVFTTIPYDSSWKVTIDGKNVNSRSVGDAFLAFEIDSGEHRVSLQYKPRGMVVGAALSIAFIVVFVLMLVVTYRKEGATE